MQHLKPIRLQPFHQARQYAALGAHSSPAWNGPSIRPDSTQHLGAHSSPANGPSIRPDSTQHLEPIRLRQTALPSGQTVRSTWSPFVSGKRPFRQARQYAALGAHSSTALPSGQTVRSTWSPFVYSPSLRPDSTQHLEPIRLQPFPEARQYAALGAHASTALPLGQTVRSTWSPCVYSPSLRPDSTQHLEPMRLQPFP